MPELKESTYHELFLFYGGRVKNSNYLKKYSEQLTKNYASF